MARTGAYPQGDLIFDAAGNLYGTTEGGGTYGYGTVFELTPTQGGGWTEKVLYSFGNGMDGTHPEAGLIFDATGNLYGTTFTGGTHGNGTVFELTPVGGGGWTEQVLHNFYWYTDGAYPFAGLIFDAAGNLYGTNSTGGTHERGTVFELTPGGGGSWTGQVLYNFRNDPDGNGPTAGLIFDAAGNLYGTTTGLDTGTCGTVFELSPAGGGNWTETVLHSFIFNDGCVPEAGLIFDATGNLYGTTGGGGAYGAGTVFEITPAGSGFYSLTVSIAGSGTVTSTDGFISCPGTCSHSYPSNTPVTLNAAPASGWTFSGWSGACTGTGPCVVTMTQDLSVSAMFTQLDYTLTVSTSGNGTVTSTDGYISCPGTCSHSYLSNTQVTLNATPASGWTFSGWSGACSGTGPCIVTMTQSLSVGATFTQLDDTLTISTTGNGTVTSTDGFISCPGTCSHSYPPDTQVTLNATPAEGWTFSYWSGSCGGIGTCVVTMTQSLSVGALFTQFGYSTLTVSPSGNGTVTSTDGFINCPGTCSHTYSSGTHVTLNATPGQGWVFGGWNGSCVGTGSCTVTMTQSLSVDAIFSQALQFVPVTPCRLVDTRITGGPIQGGTSRSFPVPQEGGCNIPATAAAYSLNVTVVPSGPLGYLTLWPTGEDRPAVSTLNSLDGRIKADAAIVPAGYQGAVSVYVTNTTNVILDIDGYFAPVSGSTLAFYPLPPCRVADTRYTTFPAGLGSPHLSALVERDFPVLSSSCNIPDTAQAYSFNFTAVPYPGLGHPLGYLEVWPKDQMPQHPVSTLNNLTGTIVANAAIVPAGTGGEITALANNDTNLVIDINGYFASAGQGGLSLYPAAPCRVIDTRQLGPPFIGTLTPPVDVVDSPCGPPATAQAYVFNATVVPPGAMGYLTLWPDGIGRPLQLSTLNAIDGWITSNMAIVSTTNGKVDAYASGLTQLILDISSYFAP